MHMCRERLKRDEETKRRMEPTGRNQKKKKKNRMDKGPHKSQNHTWLFSMINPSTT